MSKNFKSGFVAVVGRPNVGKSSLVNALVGEKVSITGPKPQTTRNKILGIKNGEGYQIAFIDTPGMLKPRNALGEYMETSIKKGLEGVDAVLVVLDAERIDEKDFEIIKKFEKSETPLFVAVNKLDITSFEKLYPKLAELNILGYIKELINVSAKTGKNVDLLLSSIQKVMPDGEPMFDTDTYTDRTERFMVAEIVREKALLFLQDEVPHGLAIDIPRFSQTNHGYEIDADIICERAGHKHIIIGKDGEMLKRIGTSARGEIEKLLGGHVFLKCFVKVESNWRNDKNQLKSMGYDSKNVD